MCSSAAWRQVSHRHAIDYDGELGFEIDAIRFRRKRHVVVWADEVVRSALIHEHPRWRGVEVIVLEGSLHECAMAVEGRAVEPLPRAWKRWSEMDAGKVELGCERTAVEGCGKLRQSRLDSIPRLERSQQRVGDACRLDGSAKVG